MIYCSEIRQFVAPMRCVQTGLAFPPYIYSLDRVFRERFPHLVIYLEIEESASAERYVDALRRIYEESNGQKLTDETLKTAVGIILELCECINEDNIDPHDLPPIHAPDSDNKMQPACDLCYNNFQWLQDDQFQFIHSHIPYIKATLLGVKENRSQLLSRHQLGIPFGQKEKLTRRINTILSGYPFDVSILKELLQNADDAGAEELHFILDCRKYESKRVFSEGWRHLQGAALLVYNNKPFSESDLAAIQNLGEGNKRDDPIQTGQYGVGFNCVYHLTDCPTFLTTVPGEGECLCAFDPHCRYVPDATNDRPGQRFTNIDYLEKKFPDVFECYRVVQTAIGNTGGTLFRLPLRTKEMAESSVLVDEKKEVTVERVKRLFDEMSGCLSHYLLFLKCVKSIKLSEIDRSGCLKLIVCSDACVDSSSVNALNNFNNHVRCQSRLLKESKCLQNAALSDVSYTMTIKTRNSQSKNQRKERRFRTKNNEGNWLIIKRFGFCDVPEFPKDLLESYQEGSLGLIPLGGLAVPLMENKFEGNFNLFCLLPLPIDSHLPVHINGHFALDYESRRSLSTKKLGMNWNQFLMEKVIAPSYLNLLVSLKEYLTVLPLSENTKNWYFQKFPTYYDDRDPLNVVTSLTLSVYRLLRDSTLQLYPMLNWENPFPLSWHSLFGDSTETIFDNLDEQKPNNENRLHLANTLKRFGMVLIDCPVTIRKCFAFIKVSLNEVSPTSICKHFSCYNYSSSIANTPVSDTPFCSVELFQVFFNYIFETLSRTPDHDIESGHLQGMPFILDNLENVRLLDSRNHLYYSNWAHLLPTCQNLFIHRNLSQSSEVREVLNVYCHSLNITDFAKHIDQVLPYSKLSSGIIESNKFFEISKLPKTWIRILWDFIGIKFKHKKEQVVFAHINSSIHTFLSPIDNWCFVPVLRGDAELFIPISQLRGVIYYEQSFDRPFVSALRALNVYRPNLHLFVDSNDYQVQHSMILTEACGKPENPSNVLESLKLVSEYFNNAFLNLSDALSLCEKFDYWIKSNSSLFDFLIIVILKKIPMYVDVCGNITNIRGSAYTLPCGVPKEEMDHWLKEDNPIVFIQNQFSNLLGLINCMTISIDDLYLNIIFKNISALSQHVLLNHIEFLKRTFNSDEWGNLSRSSQIIDVLKTIEFIPHPRTQTLCTADFYYYQQCYQIFELMRPDEILPEPYRNWNWIRFLTELGLNKKICDQNILMFAKEISTSRNIKQSDELARYIYGNCENNSNLISTIKSIPFLAPYCVSEDLSSYHLQYGAEDGCLPFISFKNSVVHELCGLCWTQRFILPQRIHSNGSFGMKDNLEVSSCVDISVILKHLQTLCSKYDPTTNPKWFTPSILAPIFRHLKTAQLNDTERKEFGNSNIIPLENFSSTVKPIHIVKDLTDSDQIKPYLCKFPIFLGEFEDLFTDWGTKPVADSSSYAEVLFQLHENYSERIVGDQNLIGDMKRASIGFLSKLDKEDYNFNKVLYLPTTGNTLSKSEHLVYIDDPALKSRIGHINQPIFNDFSSDLDCVKLLEKLPENIRPIPLSNILIEEISSMISSSHFSGLSMQISDNLSDIDFIDGIVRLLIHFHPEDIDETLIRASLENVTIISVTTLITMLKQSNIRISGSDSQKLCFLTSDNSAWKIYIKADLNRSNESIVLTKITEYLLKIFKLRTSPAAHIITMMLTIDCPDISSTLDSFSVRQYNSANSSSFLFPSGTLLPLALHGVVLQEIVFEFKIRTYVAYQSYDPLSQEEEPVYVVARILKFMRNSSQPFKNECLIDLGSGERKQVSILYLYNYHSSIGNDAYDEDIDQVTPNFDSSVKFALSTMLNEMKQLPPNLQNQLMKRLLLKWHPDKNPNHSKACLEICNYLKDELSRTNSSVSFDYVTSRVDYHRRYRGQRSVSYSDYRRSEFSNPQPTEARRWLKQAEYDLRSANNDCCTVNESYEWVCLKCHQASEKALKAVTIAENGNYSHSHNLPGLCCDSSISSFCQSLENIGSSVSFRYPDQHSEGRIPHDIYSSEQSEKAKELAEKIVSKCRTKLC